MALPEAFDTREPEKLAVAIVPATVAAAVPLIAAVVPALLAATASAPATALLLAATATPNAAAALAPNFVARPATPRAAAALAVAAAVVAAAAVEETPPTLIGRLLERLPLAWRCGVRKEMARICEKGRGDQESHWLMRRGEK
jgi:hypothetical protein